MVINLGSKLQRPLAKNLYRFAAPLVERGLGIRDFNDLCERTRRAYATHPQHPSARAWFVSALQELGARYTVEMPEHFVMPEGPLLIVSNHPFGLLDPIILGDFLSQHRPQVRFMMNFLLDGLEEMRPWTIPVNPFHNQESARGNLKPMKEALRFLKEGGALAIFPSGEVAHFELGEGMTETQWSSHVGAMVRRTGASVLPVYFKGRNSVMFQTAGLLHPSLRTGLLLRELMERQHSTVEMRVGRPIPFSRLKKFDSDEALTSYLRLHTFILQPRTEQVTPRPQTPPQATTPLYLSSSTRTKHSYEIESLKQNGQRLVQLGNMSVYVAKAEEIPLLLMEIGRLREVTFRTVGEGTGEPLDLDHFDRNYLHLFLWDEEKHAVAGGYRLGRCDKLLRKHGTKGLYTNTLFKFKKGFLEQLDDALEMGRSFIVPEYQRHLSALPLLWKGITTWVAQHPRYHKLFGPVSISGDYQHLSRKLIIEFLKDRRCNPELAKLVKPRLPFKYAKDKAILREFVSAAVEDVDDFSAIISSLEQDGKGIPVLLKHYLRLNGTLLSFNVDRSFSSCLDGLIHVDLLDVSPRLLAKYMGEEASRGFLRHHGRNLDGSDFATDSVWVNALMTTRRLYH